LQSAMYHSGQLAIDRERQDGNREGGNV